MIHQDSQEISLTQTISYLGDGLHIALSKECRVFVIIPIMINLVVLSLGGYLVVQGIMFFLEEYLDKLPEWLSFLKYILSWIISLTVGFVFCYLFSTIATIIASPFYGLLAERAEGVIRGAPFASTSDASFQEIMKDVPRIVWRELQKLGYYLPRLFGCMIISIIPVVNLIAPLLWFLLAAWMMCIQYVDYAYDNHKISFKDMKKDLKQQSMASVGIGAAISLAMTIPLLNLVIPPAAVCAGTKYYVEIQKRYTLNTAFL